MAKPYGLRQTDSPISISRNPSGSEETLEDYFQQCTRFIRNAFSSVENQYGKPTISYTLKNFNRSPFLLVWLLTFVSTSIFPVLSFIGACLFVLSTVIFVALVVSLSVSLSIISVLASVLFFVLGLQLSVAAALTFSGTSTYLGTRLVVLLLAQHSDIAGLRKGFALWREEVREFVLPAAPPQQTETVSQPQQTQEEPVARKPFRRSHLRAVSFTAPRQDEDTSFEEEGFSPEHAEPQVDTEWFHHRFGDRYDERPDIQGDSVFFPRDDVTMDDPATLATHGEL